jgi:hypothetical protein
MCDTLTLITDKGVWLAKNSDRHPKEVQSVEFYSSQALASDIQCTYISVRPRTSRSHGMILGRPNWMWGAEMGVNDQGLAVGNEAVFTRLTKRQKSTRAKLLGMDLLRLALMQADTANTAIDCIAHYLEGYGQGGNAGYSDKKFYYDNSFLIADRRSAWIMETAAESWAAKEVKGFDAISNGLIIDKDYQRSNLQVGKRFASGYRAFLLPRLARARTRRQQNLVGLKTLQHSDSTEEIRQSLMTLLGQHQPSGVINTGNVCMHAKGRLCPDETVNSMVVYLPNNKGEPQVWMTGCSHPCQSEFIEVKWSENNWFAQRPGYWEERRLQLNAQ